MKPDQPTVLVVEDSDQKFLTIQECLVEAVPNCTVVRAGTMTEGERLITIKKWDLIILDISLDIAPSNQGIKGRGQANIGGLGIAHKMFLLEKEAPTIIVTAFDSFSALNAQHGQSEIVGFEEVVQRARSYLGNSLIACFQYNAIKWREQMVNAVKGVVGR